MAQKATLYNWNDLPSEVVRKGVSRSGFRGDDVLLVMNKIEPGIRTHTANNTNHCFFFWIHLQEIKKGIGAIGFSLVIFYISDYI